MIAEEQKELVEPLLERAREYWTTSLELYKLKALDKASRVIASLVTRIVMVASFTIFFLFINIAIALWLGDVLSKSFYGFFWVAGFYFAVWLMFLAFRPGIKKKISDAVIARIMSDDKED